MLILMVVLQFAVAAAVAGVVDMSVVVTVGAARRGTLGRVVVMMMMMVIVVNFSTPRRSHGNGTTRTRSHHRIVLALALAPVLALLHRPRHLQRSDDGRPQLCSVS